MFRVTRATWFAAIPLALLCGTTRITLDARGADSANHETATPTHPWRPPFGIDAIGRTRCQGLNAAVELRTAAQRHPLSAGVVFPKHGTLIALPGDRVEIRSAVFDDTKTPWQAMFVVSLATAGQSKPTGLIERTIEIKPAERCEFAWSFVMPDCVADRATLQATIRAPDGAARWQTSVPVVCPDQPAEWPAFGALSCLLDHDLPISVRDPATGIYSELPYSKGWDPSLRDVVISLPGDRKYVFWRGSSYVPFWAGSDGVGVCYEWAEQLPPHPAGAVDCIEPLMDKELRYGRVDIVESTDARIQVQWKYQSCDLNYRVWGDQAVEDYYFYPDGFGTRVLTLTSTPEAKYELAELILLLAPGSYPLDAVPHPRIQALFLDGDKRELRFPVDRGDVAALTAPGASPAIFRLQPRTESTEAAVLFHPVETRMPPLIFAPFTDKGQSVTPAYWGSHWPLARGNMTGGAIDDRIHLTPHHVSLMSWADQQPPPHSRKLQETRDALGQLRTMTVQRWVWLIGQTNEDEGRLIARAKSFTHPPEISVPEARIAWAPERRAMRIECSPDNSTTTSKNANGEAARRKIEIAIRPNPIAVDPVFEIEGCPRQLASLLREAAIVPLSEYRWDGRVLWIRGTWDKPEKLTLEF